MDNILRLIGAKSRSTYDGGDEVALPSIRETNYLGGGNKHTMNPPVHAVNIALKYAKFLQSLGVSYAPWKGGSIGSGSPFWVNNKSPAIKDIAEGGTNCVGLINLIAMAVGVKTQSNWFEHLEKKGMLEPFKRGKVYPKGTMVLRKYKDIEDQGHIAMVVSDTEIIHAYMYINPHQSFEEAIHSNETTRQPGVIIEPIDVCLSWYKGGTFTHVCRPQNWLC
jgi:hypothetical protein